MDDDVGGLRLPVPGVVAHGDVVDDEREPAVAEDLDGRPAGGAAPRRRPRGDQRRLRRRRGGAREHEQRADATNDAARIACVSFSPGSLTRPSARRTDALHSMQARTVFAKRNPHLDMNDGEVPAERQPWWRQPATSAGGDLAPASISGGPPAAVDHKGRSPDGCALVVYGPRSRCAGRPGPRPYVGPCSSRSPYSATSSRSRPKPSSASTRYSISRSRSSSSGDGGGGGGGSSAGMRTWR